MTRRCSHCSRNGHNSRTCPNRGLKLFGVRLTDGSIRKSASVGNLSRYSGSGSSSQHNHPASSGETTPDRGAAADGYASGDFVAGTSTSSSCRERKKGLEIGFLCLILIRVSHLPEVETNYFCLLIFMFLLLVGYELRILGLISFNAASELDMVEPNQFSVILEKWKSLFSSIPTFSAHYQSRKLLSFIPFLCCSIYIDCSCAWFTHITAANWAWYLCCVMQLSEWFQFNEFLEMISGESSGRQHNESYKWYMYDGWKWYVKESDSLLVYSWTERGRIWVKVTRNAWYWMEWKAWKG